MNKEECKKHLEKEEPEVYMFLEYASRMINYWNDLPETDKATSSKLTQKDRIEGVVFSLLVAIDGGAAIGPYSLETMICDYETGDYIKSADDISGGLHERLWVFK